MSSMENTPGGNLQRESRTRIEKLEQGLTQDSQIDSYLAPTVALTPNPSYTSSSIGQGS